MQRSRVMLNTTSKYALRALVALADADGDAFMTGRALSELADVPANYLSKVLGARGDVGVIDAVRGRGGGYRLARPASEIALIEAVEVFEGLQTRPSCILGIHEECSDAEPCSAHAAFRQVRAQWIAFLEETSIEDAARMERVATPG
ncbi:MAG: Rrf2 family transcriptional regulator [Longimicrobiales bacterium]